MDSYMGFPVLTRPVYIGDYEAILREVEIWPERLTEELTGWEEYGDQDVLSVSLWFEIILDGSPETLRPRTLYVGFWPYDRNLHRVFGKPKSRPTLRIDRQPIGGHFWVAVEKCLEMRGAEAIEHWDVGKILRAKELDHESGPR